MTVVASDAKAGLFTETVIKEATDFADVAGSTLRLAIRIEAVEQLNADLKSAMAGEAFDLLSKASSHRNQKLHAVAADIIARLSGSAESQLHFED